MKYAFVETVIVLLINNDKSINQTLNLKDKPFIKIDSNISTVHITDYCFFSTILFDYSSTFILRDNSKLITNNN